MTARPCLRFSADGPFAGKCIGTSTLIGADGYCDGDRPGQSPRTRPGAALTVRVPPAFVTDHLNRDLLTEAAVLRTTTKYVEVALTAEEAEELLHDAEHYADPVNGYLDDPTYRGLVTSAAATVAALTKAGVE